MTTPPRTPTTAAGRALVESARQRSSLTWRDTPNHVALVAKTVEQTTTMVLAIEAEVRAPLDVVRLADALWAARRWVAAEWVEEGVSQPGFATTAEMAEAIAREYAALEEPTP